MKEHNIIVIGASAGGIEAVSDLLMQFPEDLQAAVFVVIHLAPNSQSVLSEIFQRKSALKVMVAKNEDEIKLGTVYIAPPDFHLLLLNGKIRLVKGPKENRMRPAVDPLFRSAAINFGTRVIGIVLTGMLDDGTSGLGAIKQCGGITIVQNPEEAIFPSMPLSALANVEIDHNVSIKKMGALINKIMNNPKQEINSIPQNLVEEVEIAQMNGNSKKITDSEKVYTCPECEGPLFQIKEDNILRFRCLTGHSYTASSYLNQQDERLEEALFTSLRILEERANILTHMLHSADVKLKSSPQLFKQAEECKNHARVIRSLIINKDV